MIKIQRKPLFRPHPITPIILILATVAFFVYATVYDNRAFVVLFLGFAFCIFLLIPLRNRFQKIRKEILVNCQHYYEEINLLEIEIRKEEAAINSFGEKIINYFQLKGLTEKLSMCLSLDDVSKAISVELNKHFGEAVTIILYLFHSKTGELGISYSHKGRMKVNIKEKQGDIFDHWVARTMQPLLVEDVRTDFRFDINSLGTTRKIYSLISSPLISANKALGILRVDSHIKHYFTTDDLRFLTTVGDLGAIAIENAQLYERVGQLATRDSLTGLYLRHYCMDRLGEEVLRHIRRQRSMAFLMLDLDNFKQYNDKYGHIAGDIVLKAVGRILSSLFNRPGTLVCRYGGEEFCVIITECRQETAMRIAEQLRAKIAEEEIVLRRRKTHITVSIGIAMFPRDAKTREDLIHKADIAMYKAKQYGKNRICIC